MAGSKGKQLCANTAKDDGAGCTIRCHKNTAGLTCTECSLNEYGVEETKNEKGKYTQYRDRLDGGKVKSLEYSGGHPILTWPMVSKYVKDEDAEKVEAQWEKNKQVKRDSEKARKARKANKPNAPASKRRIRLADAPPREDGKVECANIGCYNRSHSNIGGITCTPCAIETYGVGFDSYGKVLTIFDPEQNEEVDVSYLNGKHPSVPFGCLAHGHVAKENWETRKAFWDKKRATVSTATAATKRRQQEEAAANRVLVQPKATADQLSQIAAMTKAFMERAGPTSMIMASKGGYIGPGQGQRGDEHIAHMIRPHRGPLLLKPDGKVLSVDDLGSGGIVSFRMQQTGEGHEQLAFDAEDHAQHEHRFDKRRLWQRVSSGEHTSRGRGGIFSCALVEYVRAFDLIRDHKVALRSDMNPRTKERLIKDHPWLGKPEFAYCWVQPAFDAHIRMREYQQSRRLQKKIAAAAGGGGVDLDKKPKAKTV
mmetsp:Transcript_31431/g.67991  ORF Transcript_31431/g.67991 Transcript_31431/m.67991 type:complete len:481 (-) Transcript_31431:140-1582(-)